MPRVTRHPAPDRDSFVTRLRICEGRAGSQSALARKAGIRQSTIRGYTTRKTEPPRDVLIQLAQAAGVSPLWLVTGEGPIEQVRAAVSVGPGATNLDEGLKAIAAAAATKYSVPVEFALSRLTGSDELYALEEAMREWPSSRPIPIIGGSKNRIWGVLSQEAIEAAAPGAMLKDIKVYQVRTGNLPPPFLAGDWVLVDASKEIASGTYCVAHKGAGGVEVRELKVTTGKVHISRSMDCEEFGHTHDFTDNDSLKRSFDILGRLVGAIRFVAPESISKR